MELLQTRLPSAASQTATSLEFKSETRLSKEESRHQVQRGRENNENFLFTERRLQCGPSVSPTEEGRTSHNRSCHLQHT